VTMAWRDRSRRVSVAEDFEGAMDRPLEIASMAIADFGTAIQMSSLCYA
jgi:hypothetical protein